MAYLRRSLRVRHIERQQPVAGLVGTGGKHRRFQLPGNTFTGKGNVIERFQVAAVIADAYGFFTIGRTGGRADPFWFQRYQVEQFVRHHLTGLVLDPLQLDFVAGAEFQVIVRNEGDRFPAIAERQGAGDGLGASGFIEHGDRKAAFYRCLIDFLGKGERDRHRRIVILEA